MSDFISLSEDDYDTNSSDPIPVQFLKKQEQREKSMKQTSKLVCKYNSTCFRHPELNGKEVCPFTHTEKSSKIKRMMCKHFMNGNCTKGEKCTFAHSNGELQPTRNIKFIDVIKIYLDEYKSGKMEAPVVMNLSVNTMGMKKDNVLKIVIEELSATEAAEFIKKI